MTDPQIFNARDARYKKPYGAVPSGTQVKLTLRPPRAMGFSRALLTARFEQRADAVRTVSMPWSGIEGERDLFSAELDTRDYVGLVWYAFRLEGLDGRSLELPERQLTVYDGAEAVPAWFGDGMTYQIFPDRFCRLAVPSPDGMVGGRWVHCDWGEEPEYRPDANGEIRNRDFFGGSLAGVREKLPYLQELGVETIYFCPIFEGAENHRYGTGDYEKIDPMLGDESEFSALCREAHALGMRVMLDGVFNHTGFVSRYFNGDGSYPGLGAPTIPGSAFSIGPTGMTPGGESILCRRSMRLTPATGTISSGTGTALSAGGFGPGRTAGALTWPTSCPTTLSTASTRPFGRKNPMPSSSARFGRTDPTRSPTGSAAAIFGADTATV